MEKVLAEIKEKADKLYNSEKISSSYGSHPDYAVMQLAKLVSQLVDVIDDMKSE